jgi:hypothetical protein
MLATGYHEETVRNNPPFDSMPATAVETYAGLAASASSSWNFLHAWMRAAHSAA